MSNIVADNYYLAKPTTLLSDLKALETPVKTNGVTNYNVEKKSIYAWDPSSTASPDDDLIVKPDDVILPAPGRWLKVSSDELTTDQLEAIQNANSPSSTNVFATMDDLPLIPEHNSLSGLQGGTTSEYYHIVQTDYEAITNANSPSLTNVFATMDDLPIVPSITENQLAFGDASDQITSSSRYVVDSSGNKWIIKIVGDGGKITQLSHDSLYDISQLYSTSSKWEIWTDGWKSFEIESSGKINYEDPAHNDLGDPRDIPDIQYIDEHYGSVNAVPYAESFIASTAQTEFVLSQTPAYPQFGILTLNGQEVSTYSVSGNTITWTGGTLEENDNIRYYFAYTQSGAGVTSVFGRTGVVVAESGDYTKAQVGLGNVDNTSDLDKPISTATQTALDGKEDAFSKASILGTTGEISVSDGVDKIIGSDVTISLDSSVTTREKIFFPRILTGTFWNYPVIVAEEGVIVKFAIFSPAELKTINSVKVLFFVSPGAAGTGRQIRVDSEYCTIGEDYNAHSETTILDNLDFSALSDKLTSLDITNIFTGVTTGVPTAGNIRWINLNTVGNLYIYCTIINYNI